MVKGRHTFKAGVVVGYSGEDDFDQINVASIPGGTNNQNGAFEFLDNRAGGTGAGGLERGARACSAITPRSASAALTKWRALATDVFVQDSWKPRSEPDHRGRLPLGVLAAVVLHDQQHRQLRSALLRSRPRGGHQSVDRASRRRRPLQRHRAPGRGLRRRRQQTWSSRSDPRVQALFRDEPRGFSADALQRARTAARPRLLAQRARRCCAPAAASSTTASR